MVAFNNLERGISFDVVNRLEKAAAMDLTSLDTALAFSIILCGIAGSAMIGLAAIFYLDERPGLFDG